MILTNNLKIDTSDSCKLHCIDTTKTTGGVDLSSSAMATSPLVSGIPSLGGQPIIKFRIYVVATS